MIKVLKKGNRYKVKCVVCNSFLEYGIEDVSTDTYESSYDDDYSESGFHPTYDHVVRWLRCPVCGYCISESELEPYKD